MLSRADLADAGQRVVKIALDLHGEGTVIEGLRQFAVGNLAAPHKHDDAQQARRAGKNRQ